MKQFNRELELGFEVSAAKAVKTITRENMFIAYQEMIYQTWLEERTIGEYQSRTRIRKIETATPHFENDWKIKYEYTTKYSKNNELVAEQNNIELNANITAEEYENLRMIYGVKEETIKIRTYFRESSESPVLYSIDTYPDDAKDKARIEIEFSTKREINNYQIPEWLKKLIK